MKRVRLSKDQELEIALANATSSWEFARFARFVAANHAELSAFMFDAWETAHQLFAQVEEANGLSTLEGEALWYEATAQFI